MRVSTSAVDASIDRWARAASSDSENVRKDATNAWVTDWIHNGSCCAIAASTADRNDAADGPMCCTASRRRSVRKRANCCADGGIGGTEIMVRRVSATEAVALRFSVLHRARQQSKNLSKQDLDMFGFLQALVLKLSDERVREQLFAGELYRIRLRGHLDHPIRIAPAAARFEIARCGIRLLDLADQLCAAWKRRMRCDLVEHRFFAGTDVGLICLLHRKVQSAFFSARLFLSDVLRRIRIER